VKRLEVGLVVAALMSGCYASNVVEADQRAVGVVQVKASWRPVTKPSELEGFYASEEISGELAGGLLKAYYYFTEAGAYSGAALVVGEVGPRFRVLAEDGRWTLDETGLDLADGSGKLQLLMAEHRLRMVSRGSTITFRRLELQ
jgi:hypothetical protein